MGGADKDIDSMFIYQGFSKKLKNDYRKLENEWENVNDKDTQFDSIFGTTSPEFKDVSSKFSPSMRWQVGETAKKGNVTLGYGISQKSFMTNLMDLIHKGGAWYTFTSVPDSPKFQGAEKARDFLVSNPKVYDELWAEIKDMMGIK